MFEWFKLQIELNTQLAIWLYWVPLVVCSVVYFVRIVSSLKSDLRKKRQGMINFDQTTYGDILLHIVGAITPVVNVLCLVFDALGSFSKYLHKILRKPVV